MDTTSKHEVESIERSTEVDIDVGTRSDTEVYTQRYDTPNLSAPPPPETNLTRSVWLDILYILVIAAIAVYIGRHGWFG